MSNLLRKDSNFIHSMSEPYSEGDIEDEVRHDWLDHFKMFFHQFPASGHMSRQQLTELISYIKPKNFFPVHTEHPELFRVVNKNIRLVKLEEESTI